MTLMSHFCRIGLIFYEKVGGGVLSKSRVWQGFERGRGWHHTLNFQFLGPHIDGEWGEIFPKVGTVTPWTDWPSITMYMVYSRGWSNCTDTQGIHIKVVEEYVIFFSLWNAMIGKQWFSQMLGWSTYRVDFIFWPKEKIYLLTMWASL
jgi:hypothetical protein